MKRVKKGDNIVVWFSCGAASAVAAKKVVEKYSSYCNIRVVNTPIKEEHEDNRRFLKDVEKWIGIKIEYCISKKYPSSSCIDVWEQRKYMSGPQGAPCTLFLKKKARQEWEKENKIDWIVLGFTADEKKRSISFQKTEKNNLIPILIDLDITKQDCFNIVNAAGIELPKIYKLGYPTANCIGCSSSTYWNHVRKQHPEVFKQRAEQSRRLGTKLVYSSKYKKRIFLDELSPDEKGRSMKTMKIECGLFCEEKMFF